MNLNNAVLFIYEHALSVLNPWDPSVIKTITEPELTADGFRVVSPSYPEFRVGMHYFRNTFFVSVHESGMNYLSAAWDQKMASSIYYKIVNALTS